MYKFEIRGKGIIGKIKDILEVWVGNRRQGQRAYLPVPLFFPTSSQVLFPSNKCYFSFFVTLLEIPLSRNLFGLKASLLQKSIVYSEKLKVVSVNHILVETGSNRLFAVKYLAELSCVKGINILEVREMRSRYFWNTGYDRM